MITRKKTELTATKLYTTVYTALRAYRDILALQGNRKGLETVIDATATMFQNRNIRDFAQGRPRTAYGASVSRPRGRVLPNGRDRRHFQ